MKTEKWRLTQRNRKPIPIDKKGAIRPTIEHAQQVVHQEERSDFFRTTRSGVHTKLADVRDHDHGQQEMARQEVAHHVHIVTRPDKFKEEAEKAAK